MIRLKEGQRAFVTRSLPDPERNGYWLYGEGTMHEGGDYIDPYDRVVSAIPLAVMLRYAISGEVLEVTTWDEDLVMDEGL